MTTRTLTTTASFAHPFVLSGLDEVLPAGDYTVETDEELLLGLSFPAYRRISTMLHLRPRGDALTRIVAIDPEELASALERDAAEKPAEKPGHEVDDSPPTLRNTR